MVAKRMFDYQSDCIEPCQEFYIRWQKRRPSLTYQNVMQDDRDRVYDEKVVAADMLDFLQEFRIAHPTYFDAPLFVTGESYAGMPSF